MFAKDLGVKENRYVSGNKCILDIKCKIGYRLSVLVVVKIKLFFFFKHTRDSKERG